MRTCDQEAVAALREALAARIGMPRYEFWFENNTKFLWEAGELVIGVPNHFYQEWLQNTFAQPVHAAAVETLGKDVEIRFTIDPQLFQAARRAQGAGAAPAEADKGASLAQGLLPLPDDDSSTSPRTIARAKHTAPERSRRWHRLTDFVVGACNRVAHASAVHVVEAPGQEANPLVLHGPVGTGKTHLLEGIYAALRKTHPGWRVNFVTAEQWTNRFVQALRLGKLGPFRKQYRGSDALLVDDLNFLAKARASREEFLHTLDALQADGKQVVVTCDCHPRLADSFPPELADRLAGGGVWGLTPPDGPTRLAILRAKAGREGVAIPDEVLGFLAEHLRGNVRELEGALHGIRHYGRVAEKPIDLALAREAVADLLRHSVRVLQLADVDGALCRALRLQAGALQSKQRSWAVSHPRMLAMYLSRKHTTASYGEIGHHFGGRNHSTVVAAEKKVRQWMDQDQTLDLGGQRLRVCEIIELVERELRR